MAENYYQVLNIDARASGEEIKKAYREMALQYHPDLNQSTDSEEKIKKINEAYSVLSDPEKKSHYDVYGTVPRGRAGPADDFSSRQWNGMGFGRGRGRRCGCGGKSFGPWGGVFRNPEHRIIKEGDDYICKISFSPEELQNGTQRSFLLRDGAGSTKMSVEIPPGSKRGLQIVAAEVSGERTGKFIIEIQ